MSDTTTPWYAVRCVFRGSRVGEPDAAYEERVTLWRASSFDEPTRRAEDEAREYADILEHEYLGLAQAYWLADEPGDGAEIFSLIRRSALAPSDYLTAFFDTGTEYQR